MNDHDFRHVTDADGNYLRSACNECGAVIEDEPAAEADEAEDFDDFAADTDIAPDLEEDAPTPDLAPALDLAPDFEEGA